jgi:diguanylate cyclase
MRIIHCFANDHDPWLVGLAAVICALGAWVTVRLYLSARAHTGASRAAWVFLGAVATGSTVWCTHFVAMLAFEPGVAVSFGPGVTALSLAVAILAGAAGLGVATARRRFAPEAGGAIIGAGVAAMHYTGMAAFAADGLILWHAGYAAASVLAAVGLGTVALNRASQPAAAGWRECEAVGLLVLAIVSLHFTGMAAMTILPLAAAKGAAAAAPMADAARQVLAAAVAGVGLLVLGTGAVSHLLDRQNRMEAAARMEQERRIAHLAFHDSLTGLPNRASFLERLGGAVAARSPGEKVALLAIDLDGFKEINDLHGHAAGDHVLRVLAERMRDVLREGELVARLGGDEFVAIATVKDREEALDLAARLKAQLSLPIRSGPEELACGGSVGVALCPDDAETTAALMNNADLAMYRAKRQRARTVCFYEEAMDEAVRTRRKTAKDLRDALALGQFELHYQVQVSVQTGSVTGYEALLRWNHPVLGRVAPAEFIPLAEENGLILPIGEWVLRAACAEAASWEAPHKLAVNLSAVQFGHPDLPTLVRQVLSDTGLAPSRLELEITETALVADPARAIRVLREIRALGVTVAIDDFGAGHSSLPTLRAFGFDRIKLDKAFIGELEGSPQARAVIRAVLALGDDLCIPVLAEAVETADQLAFLREQGCDEAQGFLLGRPAPGVPGGRAAAADREAVALAR